MPRLSRQAKAAAARTRSPNSNRFVVAEDDEYFDIDDDHPDFFYDIGEDEEGEVVQDDFQEAEPVISDEFLTKLRNWRPTGWNSNVRGAGTSRRTHFRNKRKAEDIVISARNCSTMESFYAQRIDSDNSTAAAASLVSILPATEASKPSVSAEMNLDDSEISVSASSSSLETSSSSSEQIIQGSSEHII